MAELFVLGYGRSGTTVLLNALNTSDDMFLLGEANLYMRGSEPGFREQYNRKHEGWGNQATKSAYAPALPGLPEEADGFAYLEALGAHYRYVGEKVALGPPASGQNPRILRDALEKRWSDAALIWSLRRPRFAIASGVNQLGRSNLAQEVSAMAETLLLFVHTSRIRRNVFAVLHEEVGSEDFHRLGKSLQVDLSCAAAVYSGDRFGDREWGADSPFAEELERLDGAYEVLTSLLDRRRCALAQATLQVEQKLPGHPPVRPTPFGDAVRELIGLARLADETGSA